MNSRENGQNIELIRYTLEVILQIKKYYQKNNLKVLYPASNIQPKINLDLKINFENVDDRLVRESINQVAAVDVNLRSLTLQHVSNLIDLVDTHHSDDISVSRDHLAFEFLDTFSDGLNKDGKISKSNKLGSLADEFYKDFLGDDQFEKIVHPDSPLDQEGSHDYLGNFLLNFRYK